MRASSCRVSPPSATTSSALSGNFIPRRAQLSGAPRPIAAPRQVSLIHASLSSLLHGRCSSLFFGHLLLGQQRQFFVRCLFFF